MSCRHHLFVIVNPLTGSVQFPFGHLEIDQIPQTCSLDVADEGSHTLDEVGAIIGKTKERVRQIETRALALVQSPTMIGASILDWAE